MSIQWFPGHMAAARKKALETLANIDVVIEVVDARLPEASVNPMILELRRQRNRPCLRLLNKADLADAAVTREWLHAYAGQPELTVAAISAKKAADIRRIPALCQALAPHRSDGVKPLRVIVMGIPNVGKSTLINALAQRRVAAVGDEPAVTKQQQRVDLGAHVSVVDTPGLMWPKIIHASDGCMLAASHAIGVNAVPEEEVALFLGDILRARYPALLARRYGVDEGGDLLALVGKKRGCLLRGGAVDRDKAARLLLDDYRSGALGRISLETPASRAAMLAQAQSL